jgi:uncharacterized membrane protein
VKRPAAPQMAVGLMMVAYVAIFGTLSLRRHQNLRTNALDLGYTDQAVWNTLHGRPFRFSTYLDADFRLDIPIQEFKEPDVLLGYHVEPVLAILAPLYLIFDGPEVLLWLQSVVIALGAIPLYLVVDGRFAARGWGDRAAGSKRVERWLPVAFVALYLLSPSLQAASLSDFHAVALSPTLLLAAFYFLESDRPWGFVAFAALAALCKEEIGLIVMMMGLWAAVVRRRRWLGLGVAAAGLGWSLLSVQAIMPHFSGLPGSAFLVRYGQFGDSPAGILRNLVQQPGLFVHWLRRPDVFRYLRDLWLSGGALSLLHPLSLAMAVPSIAVNTFSSYDWMRSGGGHYSAAIVPFLVIAAAYGVDWLAWQVSKRASSARRAYDLTSLALVGLGFAVALIHQYQYGISPLSQRFALDPVSEHARRAEPLVERVNSLPPEVAISVSSNLYPHVAHRERVYLFPTVSDAELILFDATGPSSPAGMDHQSQVVRDLLDYGQFGIVDADHGLLLLEAGLDQYYLSPSFYDVFHEQGVAPQVPVGADFGGVLRLEGFDWRVRPVVRPELVVEMTTYWRVLSPQDDELRLAFYFWDEDRQLVRVQPEGRVMRWYPTWLWEPEQLVKVTLPPLPVGNLPHVGVAVLRPGAEDSDVGGRVAPITAPSDQPLSLWEQGTILELDRP